MKDLAILLGLLLITVNAAYQQKPALASLKGSLVASANNPACYLETENGQIIDLSQLCGRDKPLSSPINLSSEDQRFLKDYQNTLSNRFDRLPAVQAALSQANRNPQAVIQRAQATCADIQNGMSPDLVSIGQQEVDASVVSDLALDHYCPELDD